LNQGTKSIQLFESVSNILDNIDRLRF